MGLLPARCLCSFLARARAVCALFARNKITTDRTRDKGRPLAGRLETGSEITVGARSNREVVRSAWGEGDPGEHVGYVRASPVRATRHLPVGRPEAASRGDTIRPSTWPPKYSAARKPPDTVSSSSFRRMRGSG